MHVNLAYPVHTIRNTVVAVRYSVNVDLLLTHLRLALGTGGCETGRGAGRDCAGEADRHPHAASQLRTASSNERHPHQLSESMVGAQLDSNDTHLLGTCAGPDREFGDGAVSQTVCYKQLVTIQTGVRDG